jgi:carboxyl-terminal processing protease
MGYLINTLPKRFHFDTNTIVSFSISFFFCTFVFQYSAANLPPEILIFMMKFRLLSALCLLMCLLPAKAQFKLDEQSAKLVYTLNAVNALYVDTVKENKLVESAIEGMLKDLDPHSVYVSKEEVQRMKEPLEGSFEGVGIQFQMLEDTMYVVQTIAGCPAAKVGILPGDRMIYIEDTLIAGVKMQNTGIMKKLRGPKGSVVHVKILRRGEPGLIEFSVTRDKIPIYSIDASYMVDKEIGYVKINSFGATTHSEFLSAVSKLNAAGMKSLIIDLQGNGGGYLQAATDMANEFLKKGNLLVYTQGLKQPRMESEATGYGNFPTGKLIILIDEYSASASEILTGAIQDWDRGVVVGRRSFGKGLVQRQIDLPDGSMMRLTTARYYTPSGRCIQKSYKDGIDKYERDISDRFKRGEFQHADSIHFADSLKYKTLRLGRTVYGGGGIMPDVFVPLDTTFYTDYLKKIIAKGVVNKISTQYIDQHRQAILSDYKTFDDFNARFAIPQSLLDDMVNAATKEKVTFNEEQFGKSKSYLVKQLKALISNDLYGRDTYYRILNTDNESVEKAVEIFKASGTYDKLIMPLQSVPAKKKK